MEIDLLHWLGLDYLYSPGNRIFVGYLSLSLAIGLLVGRLTGQRPGEWLGGDIWWHPSARLDYRYFLVTSAIKLTLIVPAVIGAGDVAAYLVRLLDEYFGYRAKLGSTGAWLIAAYAVALFLANDASRYLLHRLMHRVPALWAIHRVHHGAEVLTPFTFYRVHPLESLLFGLRYALAAGVVTALFVYSFGAGLRDWQVAGVNAFVLAAHLLGDNLRHSHLRWGYPGWLEHLLISPMQHQFHHDRAGGRYNYGGVLAIWDWMFGSLRTSRRGEQYRFGVAGEPPPVSVLGLLFAPLTLGGRARWSRATVVPILLLGLACPQPLPAADTDADKKVLLGRSLFFDTILSLDHNQSCASCHDPARAFSETRDSGVGRAASLGDDLQSLGDRNTPSLGYVSLVPEFHFDAEKQRFLGGLFWDGRARDLADQAGQPILNPIEMAMPDKQAVIDRLQRNDFYRTGFTEVYGDGLFDDVERAYAALADSIAAFETTDFFGAFDSKYDRYLRGEYELTELEDLGMSVFFSTTNSNCSTCHQLKVMDDEGEPFTNFEYHNIGTPPNLALRARNGVAADFRDPGLGGQFETPDLRELGKFRVPGLRNVAVTGPYMHNGVFRDLRTVIEFYDQYNNPDRADNPETGEPWAEAEVAETVSLEDLKAKKLSERKIEALIAFLETLTDRRYEYLLKN